MAHGFQGIGKLPESKGYKDLHNWAWDKLKKAAKKVGETKKKTALGLTQDKSIFPVDVSVIDVTSEEVEEAVQIAGQTAMFGLPSKKGGAITNFSGSGLAGLQPKRDPHIRPSQTIVHYDGVSQDGIYSPTSMGPIGQNDPSDTLQRIADGVDSLVREVKEHKHSMVHMSLRKEKHDDVMMARSRAFIEQKMFKGGSSSPSGGGRGGDFVNMAMGLAMGGGSGGGSGDATMALMSALGGTALGRQAGKSLSGLGKTGKSGSIMKHGIGRAAKRGLAKAGGKAALKGGAKVGAKAIPGVGLALGLMFGLGKFAKGDWLGGLAEIGSGALSMTGAGIPAAIALDTAILARDMSNNAASLNTGGRVNKQPTGGIDGEGGFGAILHPDEIVSNEPQLKRIPEYFLDHMVQKEQEYSKVIGLGLYWNQKKYPGFWGGGSGGSGNQENEPPSQFQQATSQLLRALIGSQVGDGHWGPQWLRIFNENTPAGRQARAEDEVVHGEGITATLRAVTGSQIGDGYWGPRWLNWKRENQPTVDPQQVLRYLQSQGISTNDAINWTNKINDASGFVGSMEGGLFGWEGSDFAAMKSAVGDDWQNNWQGQLDYLIKEQVILPESGNNTGTNNNSGTGGGSVTNTGNETANNLNQLSADQAIVQAGNNPIVVNNVMSGEGSGQPGTTPSGYLNGISMADTGTEVFSNLRIRSIR